MNTLAREVSRFRAWAEAGGFNAGRGGEWECDYPDWPSLYAAVEDFLTPDPQRTLTPGELGLLLYVLARDNEDERVLEMLQEFPGMAAQVAEAAVTFPDAGARWQAAVLAGRVGLPAVLRRFLEDEAEYVRRRAGLAWLEMERGR